MTEKIIVFVLFFLYLFTAQSLMILMFRQNKLMRLLPLVFYFVPCYFYTSPSIRLSLSDQDIFFIAAGISAAITIGIVAGWIVGLKFRKILDEERKEMEKLLFSEKEEANDNSNEKMQ